MDIFSKNKHLFKINNIPQPQKKQKEIIKNNVYKYNIFKHLTNISITNNDNINICIFNINNNSPILSYLLINNNNYTFPYIKNTINLVEKCNMFVFNILKCNLNPVGFIHKNNESYIFYNYENDIVHSNNTWCIMDEICNKKKYLKTPISESVSLFFLNNPYLIFLVNKNNIKIEIPIVSFNNNDKELYIENYLYSNDNKHYDYNNVDKNKIIIRYAIFILNENYEFNKKYQYSVNYTSDILSIHK